MMKLTRFVAAGAAVVVCAGISWGAGIWSTLPIIGGAAYCASSIGTAPVQAGPTGFGAGVAGAGVTTGQTICGQTVPAGPAVFAGTEYAAMDLYTPGTAQQVGGPMTALVNINQLGNGVQTINTTAGNITIANNTSWFIENVGNTTPTFTLPSAPVHGQIQHITLATAQTTSFIVTNNTGQTCLPACPQTITTVAAGSGFGFLYNGPSAQWTRIY